MACSKVSKDPDISTMLEYLQTIDRIHWSNGDYATSLASARIPKQLVAADWILG
jgi:hypothetical protein